MVDPFFGNFDLASLTLWLFWVFFALLIIYIQRENMREGYPMINEDGTEAANLGIVGMPMDDKVFKLPHGRGEFRVPSGQPHGRNDVALKPTSGAAGYPFDPTGNPLVDGVGPAAWADRRDEPELDGKGHPKIVPMSKIEAYGVSAGKDPRGMVVMSGDGKEVGTVTDMWIDEPEQLVRYLEYTLAEDVGKGSRLVPMTWSQIWFGKVYVSSIYAEHFADVPTHASGTQVTKLEEEKISAYYGGGILYASDKRFGPLIG